MPQKAQTVLLIGAASLTVGFLAGFAFGQASPPTETKGQSATLL